jgi:hypothetical protein
LVDLDHDGRVDLISGSWPGELFLFRGGPNGTFAAPEMLEDKRGEVMNLFGGWTEEQDGERLLTGHGEIVEQDEGTFVRYHGKLFESTPERPIAITGSATTVNAFDWDGDGDEDLIVGEFEGRVALVPNEGTAKKWAFGERRDLEAGGVPIRVSGDAGPYVADWDGDGLPDLLVGSSDGSVRWYRNTGTRTKPVLAQGVEILPRVGEEGETPNTPTRGIRSKICAVDWNGDGKLDLLVGDLARMKADHPEPTPEERAVHAKIRKELEAMRKEFAVQLEKLRGPNRVKDRAERKAVRGKLDDLSKHMEELGKGLPKEEEDHGWVWLFLRK